MLLQGLKRDATALRVIYDLPYITRVELRVGSSTFLLALMRYVSVVRLVRLSLYAENSFGCRSCGAQTKVIHLCQREECKNGSEHCGTVAEEEEEEASND